MAGNASNYLELELLDHVLKTGAYSVPSNIYIALSTADPTESGGSIAEPSGNNYSRTACNTWDAASSRATQNTNAVTFPTASGSWGTITHWAAFDASTSGNMLFYGPISSPSSLAVASGYTPRFAAGAIDIVFDTGGVSTYLANKLLDHVLKTSSYTQPTNIYVALSTANPTDGGGSIAEPSGNNYSRVNNNTWDVAASGATANTSAISFATASGSWGTLTYSALFDASTSGNMLFYGALGSSLAISSGLNPEFAAGDFDITLN